MATPTEVTTLQICVANADLHIDAALDQGNRRAFRIWCKRRAALLARIERALVSLAIGP